MKPGRGISFFQRGLIPVIIVFLAAFIASFFYAQAPSMGDDIDYYGFALHRHFYRSEFPPSAGFHFLRWPVWGLIWIYQFFGGFGWGSFLFVPFFCLALTCALAFFIGRELGGAAIGGLTALLVFFHPLMDPLIVRPMPDVVEGVLSGLGFLVIWRFLNNSGKHSFFSSLAYGTGLGILIFTTWANRPTGLIWVIAVGLLSLFRWREVWLLWIGALVVAAICFGVEAWIYKNVFGSFWHSLHANLEATGRKGTEPIPFWELPFRFFDTFAFGNILKPPYFLLMLGGCWILWKEEAKGKWVVGWLILVYLGISCAVQPVFPLRPLVRDGARFLGAVVLPAGILTAFGLQALWQFLIKRWCFLTHPFFRNSAVMGLVIFLFSNTTRDRWNPDFLPELRAWLQQIKPGEVIKTHNNFYEAAFLADAKKAKQLTWSIFHRGELVKTPDLLNPSQEDGLKHLLLHRPRVIVTVRKALEEGKVLDSSTLNQDLLSADSRWGLKDVLYRSSEEIRGGVPDFFWFQPISNKTPSINIISYAQELKWRENPSGEDEREFFEKKGSGKLFFDEERGLVFERTAPGQVVYILNQSLRLPEEMRGRVLDFRLNTLSHKVEPFRNYVTFFDSRLKDIETQKIEFYAASNGFWDFSAVKIPPDAVFVQWKISIENSCQNFILKEVRLLSE